MHHDKADGHLPNLTHYCQHNTHLSLNVLLVKSYFHSKKGNIVFSYVYQSLNHFTVVVLKFVVNVTASL